MYSLHDRMHANHVIYSLGLQTNGVKVCLRFYSCFICLWNCFIYFVCYQPVLMLKPYKNSFNICVRNGRWYM